MTTEHEDLRAKILPVLRPYASRITLFGSLARGEAHPASDIDLLVVLRPAGARPPLGLHWFELEAELTERLGRKVDLVTEAALSPYVRPYVEQDQVVLYEE